MHLFILELLLMSTHQFIWELKALGKAESRMVREAPGNYVQALLQLFLCLALSPGQESTTDSRAHVAYWSQEKELYAHPKAKVYLFPSLS